jgi:hypothetical protein
MVMLCLVFHVKVVAFFIVLTDLFVLYALAHATFLRKTN